MYGSAKLLDFVTGLIRIAANERTGRGASWKDLNVLVIDLLAAPGRVRYENIQGCRL
jgi:hypothetical protein